MKLQKFSCLAVVINTGAKLIAPYLLIFSSQLMAQTNFETLVRKSTFIFQARVTKLGAVTMPLVPVSNNTIIVKVDTVLEAPSLQSGISGKEITVLTKDTTSLKVEEQVIIFAKGWLLGESLAVQEVGLIREIDIAELRRRIDEALKNIADEDLIGRIKKAVLIVVGNITQITDSTRQTQDNILTEHDPQWREADLRIEEVLKGDDSLSNITLLFPGTQDIAWLESPRFNFNQEGIWILQQQQEVYTGLDPLDFQTKDQLDRIRDLIKRSGE